MCIIWRAHISVAWWSPWLKTGKKVFCASSEKLLKAEIKHLFKMKLCCAEFLPRTDSQYDPSLKGRRKPKNRHRILQKFDISDYIRRISQYHKIILEKMRSRIQFRIGLKLQQGMCTRYLFSALPSRQKFGT